MQWTSTTSCSGTPLVLAHTGDAGDGLLVALLLEVRGRRRNGGFIRLFLTLLSRSIDILELSRLL